jgi:hypothetical protein
MTRFVKSSDSCCCSKEHYYVPSTFYNYLATTFTYFEEFCLVTYLIFVVAAPGAEGVSSAN